MLLFRTKEVNTAAENRAEPLHREHFLQAKQGSWDLVSPLAGPYVAIGTKSDLGEIVLVSPE